MILRVGPNEYINLSLVSTFQHITQAGEGYYKVLFVDGKAMLIGGDAVDRLTRWIEAHEVAA